MNNETKIATVMSLGYGKFSGQIIVDGEVVNMKYPGNSVQECVEEMQEAYGPISLIHGEEWKAVRYQAVQRLIASLVRVDEGAEVTVDEILYEKHPNSSNVRKVIICRVTKNFIFARYCDSMSGDPMKFRKDGSIMGDEHKRCRLFRKAQ